RREERSFRVVVRGIHASTSTDAIRNELTCMGYTIRNVYCPKYKNRSGPGTYQPNIFFVELAPDSTKNRSIFEIRNLCKYVVRFEWPKIDGKNLPQCHRCQRFNHTARYCRHPARCVKCGNEHLTQTCVKPANVPATCANCGSDHTANYKGCPLYLDLLQAKLLSLPNSKNISPNVRQPQPKLQRRQKQPQRQQSAQLQLQQQQQQQKQQQVQLQRQLPKPKLINNKNNKKSKQNGGQIGTQPIQNQKLQTSTPAGVPRKSATPITNNNINTANNANNSNPPTVSSSNSLDPRSRWARIQSLQQQQQQQRQLERPDSVQTREQIISRQRQMLENWSIRQQATTANQPVTQQQSTPMQVDVEQRQLLPSPQQQQLYQTPSSNDLQNDILLQMANKQQEQLDGLMGSRREERSFRVVVRGIHASTSTGAIRNELTCMGYTIRNVYCPKYKNRSGPGTYQPNIFFVELAPDSTKNRSIFEIRNLCKYVVRFEWPKIDGKNLPQCHRCQRFNHTARYCRHPARCVKCGNEHLTQTCVKPANVPATCANCGSDHTANYKGCPLYLDLLQAKLLSLPNSKNISPNVRQPQPKLQRRQKQPQRQQSAQLQLQQQQQQQKQQQVQLQRQLPKPKLINNKNNKKSKQNGGQIGTQPIQNQKLQTSTPAGVPRKSATPITNNNINTANNANNSNPPTVSSSNSLDPRSRWARIQSLQQQQQQQRQLERPDSVQTREQIISRQRQMLENWSIRQQATTANQPVTQQQSTPMQVDVEQRQLLPSPQQQQLYQTPSSNDLQNDILLQMANKQQEQLDGLMGS
ncbi:putative uncharacterized protein DDB_G0271606, partial [Drosophila virilis]|uniref:putative uncharacterized protein DDB_G0271606 n=1 Tax=Drosophila virilis TaxID=7244 RepID=UPI0038B37649